MNNSTFSKQAIPEQVVGYRLIHGYVSGTICFIGIIFNILNGFVWSQRTMRTSINILLTALSFTDGTTLFFYLVYATYFFTVTGPSELIYHSKGWMYIVVICFHEFIAFCTISNGLTISLAIFRYMKICHPKAAERYCNSRRAKLVIVLVFILSSLAMVPYYLFYEVYDLSQENLNLTGYWIRKTTFARNHVDFQRTVLWLYGMIYKVVPTIAMIFLSAFLIREVYAAGKRRQHLHVASPSRFQQTKIKTGYKRTTIMLVIIVLIYVLMELPVGIMAIFSGMEDDESHYFYFLLYSHAGHIVDMTGLLNATVNFIVYFCIKKQFRFVLKEAIFQKRAKRNDPRYTHGERTCTTLSHDITIHMELSTSPIQECMAYVNQTEK
ncbi:probable G-protein coupled receptor 139 [Saccostrea echinata]|uniref:probable G-protein coupled receptor 139 n=1 Tax=Saccostrea echinata TaxID=191078 RepID=UPI002A8316FA|nr:probable G-protein coupled receptor 139 [Saccostrea echinata]